MKIREYEILDKIGEPGGMAVVYKAKHQSLEVIRAIKKLHFHLSTNQSIIQRFENEAKALSILEHPHIVKVYDFFREEESYYLIMEYIDGPSLAEVLKKSAIKERVALEYLKQILSTMSFAHSKKILHRDIKPSNILINSADVIKVVDFGIAKMMDRKGITSTGFTMGSPWYMSPEQIIGHELDARSDIYSLGITLFEMLTAKVPFNDTSEYKIYEKHQKEPLPSLKEYNKKLSADLDSIIQKATAKKPEERYQTADEFAEAIDIYLALSEFGGKTKATIADFDPSEYMKIDKTRLEAHTEFSPATIAKTKLAIESMEKMFPEMTKEKQTKTEQDKKRTAYQQATVFQEDDDTRGVNGKTSDLIDRKKIDGLETERNPHLFKYIMIAAAVLIAISGIIFLLLMDSGPDQMALASGKISYNAAELKWSELEDVDFYQISRKKPEMATFLALTNISAPLYTDTTVTPGETYQYQVSAYASGGKIRAIGELRIEIPGIEFDFTADIIEDKKATFSWNQIREIQAYILYRRAESEELREIYRGNTPGFTDLDLKPDRSYDYMLKAILQNNSEFESSYLNIVTNVSQKVSPKLAFGTLNINSTPGEAKIFMDGRELATTPFIRKGLTAGIYDITIKKEGFSDFNEKVSVRANKVTDLSPELVSLKGTLSIRAKPYGTILIDGKVLKEDSPTAYQVDLLAGKHKVIVAHSGLSARWEKEVLIEGGKVRDLIVDFTKMCSLTIVSDPAGMIIVDGVSTGHQTPKEITVRTGQHAIGVRLDGFEMVGGSQIINIENDLPRPIEFILKPRK